MLGIFQNFMHPQFIRYDRPRRTTSVLFCFLCAGVWSSGKRVGLPIVRFGDQTAAGQKFGSRLLFHLRRPAPPSQLSYDEYTDRTLSVGRGDGEGKDWPPVLICRG